MNKLLKLAIRYNLSDKTRSIITIITVFIAAFLVFFIIILVQTGLNFFFSELLLFQPDQLVILPTTGGIGSGLSFFNDRDYNTIRSSECITLLYPTISKRADYKYKDKEGNLNLIASDLYLLDNELYISLKEGRRISEDSKRVVVIGYTLWKNLDIKIGDNFIIQNRTYRVIGLLDKSNFQDTDNQVFVSLEDGKDIFGDEYNALLGRYNLQCDEEKVIDEIKAALSRSTRQVTVISSKFIRENIGSILDAIGLASIFLSLISSVIASFGITNTILASIIKRKKQIAVMKTIGATDGQVLLLIFYQISILVLSGIGLALIISLLLAAYLNNILPVYYKIEQLLFNSIILYLVSIIFPIILVIRNILKISPIEALRD